MKLKEVTLKAFEGKTIKRIKAYKKFLTFHFTDGTSFVIVPPK